MSVLISFLITLITVNSETAYTAYFTSDVTGVDGYVAISKQRINIRLDIVDDTKILPACRELGLSYHLHYWDAEAIGDTNQSITACGFTYTQNHYDPWAACGSASNNPYCTSDTPAGTTCIPKSAYNCDSSSDNYPYNCEVGDWSGKYGKVTQNDTTGLYGINTADFWEVTDTLLGDNNGPYSIVFHCSSSDDAVNGLRALCGRLVPMQVDDDRDLPDQNTDIEYVKATFDVFGNNDYVKIMSNGDIDVNLDGSGAGLDTINDCDGAYYIGIYNNWSGNMMSYADGSECANVVGYQYDPTNSCFDFYGDSEYCNGTMLCGDDSYAYGCSSSMPWECSPSDLTGRYMSKLMFDPDTVLSETITTTNSPSLVSPLDQLVGKSVVIYCPDPSGTRGMMESIIACAGIMNPGDTTTMMTTSTNTTTKAPAAADSAVLYSMNLFFFLSFLFF